MNKQFCIIFIAILSILPCIVSVTDTCYLAPPSGYVDIEIPIQKKSTYSIISPERLSQDKSIAFSVVYFFVRKGVYFPYGLEDVIQDVYAAFSEARMHDPEISDDELWRIAFKAATASIGKEKKAKRIIKSYRTKKIIPLSTDTLGERILLARLNKGYKRKDLKNKTGFSIETIARWEWGKKKPKPSSIIKIADVLEVSVCYLMTGFPEKIIMSLKIEDENSLQWRKLLAYKAKILRYKYGLKIFEIAQRLGISINPLYTFERGERMLFPSLFRSLVKILHSDVCFLLSGMNKEELLCLKIDEENIDDYKKLLGYKIKILRYDAGLLLRELGDKVGVTETSVGLWEMGVQMPNAHTIKRLSKIFNISVCKLKYGMEIGEYLSQKSLKNTQKERVKLFGKKIKILRLEKGLYQYELGAIIGIGQGEIDYYEKGKGIPYPPNMRTLAKYFNTSVSLLLWGMTEDEMMNINTFTRKYEIDKNVLGQKIRMLRLAKGLYVKELARKIGTKKTAIVSWENGIGKPTPKNMQKLCRFFNISVSRLISGKSRDEVLNAHSPRSMIPLYKYNFALKMIVLRYTRGLTKGQLSQQSKIDKHSIGFWERGERYPDHGSLKKTSRFFHVSVLMLKGEKRIIKKYNINSNQSL